MQREDGLTRIFYRLVATNPPTPRDMLSQAARRQPPPRTDAAFLEAWAGLSVFDSYEAIRAIAVRFKWRHGEYIAVLALPDLAPLTLRGPDHKGHWMLYDHDGRMLEGDSANALLQHVIEVIHGPSTPTYSR